MSPQSAESAKPIHHVLCAGFKLNFVKTSSDYSVCKPGQSFTDNCSADVANVGISSWTGPLS